jgi:hypothetical protein
MANHRFAARDAGSLGRHLVTAGELGEAQSAGNGRDQDDGNSPNGSHPIDRVDGMGRAAAWTVT